MSNSTVAVTSIQIPSLYDLTLEQLTQQLAQWGEPAFRAKQIWRWLYQRFVQDIDEMSDISKPLRGRLKEHFALRRLTALTSQQSSDGWTRKWLLQLPDGSEIETVLMEYDGVRRTACISSQAGCAMNCSFCATGQMGFLRNLRAGEIIEQVIWVARALAETTDDGRPTTNPSAHRASSDVGRPSSASTNRLSNLVFMGMGEPFANYNNVMEAARRLMQPEAEGGFGLGARKITVSTVGLVPGIRKFTDEDTQVNLAISLHAATDELRNQLVPINLKFPLKELTKAARDYIIRSNRRLSFEWALIEGVNDTVEQAQALVDLIRQTTEQEEAASTTSGQAISRRKQAKADRAPNPLRSLIHVNMIPLNPTRGFRGHASQRERIARFREVLDKAGIPNTVRVRRGIDIAAGCGQLREHSHDQAGGQRRGPRLENK